MSFGGMNGLWWIATYLVDWNGLYLVDCDGLYLVDHKVILVDRSVERVTGGSQRGAGQWRFTGQPTAVDLLAEYQAGA